MSEDARRAMSLMAGAVEAHGTYRVPTAAPDPGTKVEIKTTARTVREPVTVEVWADHLAGRRPLGIITLREDDKCLHGVIDVDRYDVSHAELAAKIAQFKLPLIVTRSKSGGAHIFLFLSQPADPTALQAYLRRAAVRLGVGGSEIFPKQTKVLRERGDLGNWIAMPYYGATQEAVKPTGATMTLREFLTAGERGRIKPSALDLDAEDEGGGTAGHADGPPCLQHLCGSGFPEGTRNNGLFALGVYCRKKYGDRWAAELEEMNRKYMKPPLPSDEVQVVIRSLEKREYSYKCDDQPLASHCNRKVCLGRRFGVGDSGVWPAISGLSVLDADPPLWFLDVDDARVETDTEGLQNYRVFHKLCMEQLHVCFRPLGQDAWLRLVAKAMETVSVIDVPPEVGRAGRFLELLEEFLTNRQRGEREEDLLSGRPWQDPATGQHFFPLRTLQDHMDREGLRMVTRPWITQRIRDLGGGHIGRNIRGKFRNLWWVPSSVVSETPTPRPPALKEEPI